MKNIGKDAEFERGYFPEGTEHSRMVIKTLTHGMKLTPAQTAMLEDAARQPIVYESDCPELTPEMAEAFRKAASVRDT